MIFGEKKGFWTIMCVLSFFTTFVWNVSHSKKNSKRYYHKCTCLHVQYLLFLLGINNNIYLLQLGCYPVAVVILHVNKTWNWLLLNLSQEGYMRSLWWQLGILGTISAFADRHRETKKNLCRGGRSQDLPDAWFQPSATNWMRTALFCVITQRVVVISWRFGTTYQSKIRPISCTETSVRNYQR